MKNTMIVYITMGLLTVVPLILFNIRKIWVRRPPEPLKFRPVRFCVILLLCAALIGFLVLSYNTTLENRYEIALERLAEKHGEMLKGSTSAEELRAFVMEHGTEQVAESFDAATLGAAGSGSTVRFQLSDRSLPKYWTDVPEFDQPAQVENENPIYAMYVLESNDELQYFAVRMTMTDEGWKYDWFGNANEQHQKIIKMPTLKNGKWYTVE